MPRSNGHNKTATRESNANLAELEEKYKALERRVALLEAKLTNVTLPGAIKPVRLSLPPSEGDTSDEIEGEEGDTEAEE